MKGTTDHRRARWDRLLRISGATAAVTLSVLFATGAAHPHPIRLTVPLVDEPEEPVSVSGPRLGLLIIDNSNADSWLEVDRTLNTQAGSKGTAGSDHDGGGGAIDVRSRDVSGTGNSPAQSGDPAQDED